MNMIPPSQSAPLQPLPASPRQPAAMISVTAAQDTGKATAKIAAKDALKLQLPSGSPPPALQGSPAQVFAALEAGGRQDQAAAMLVQRLRSPGPEARAQLQSLLAQADSETAVAFLSQTGFLLDQGVFPIALDKLPEADAKLLTGLIDALKRGGVFNDTSLLIQGLQLRGAVLEPAAEREALIEAQILDASKDALKLLARVDERLRSKQAGPIEQAALVNILRQLKDADAISFLRQTGFLSSGTEGYSSTRPKALAHLPRAALVAISDNLDEGFAKYLDWSKWDLISELDAEIRKRPQ